MADMVTRREFDMAMKRLRDEVQAAVEAAGEGAAREALEVARRAETAAGAATEATIAMGKRIDPTLNALGRAEASVEAALAVLRDTVDKAVASLRDDVASVHGAAGRAEGRADEVEKALHRVNGELTEAGADRAAALTRYVDDEIRQLRVAMAEAA